MASNFDHTGWALTKQKLNRMYPELSKSDLMWRFGTRDDLIDMIAFKLGKTAKELQQEIDAF